MLRPSPYSTVTEDDRAPIPEKAGSDQNGDQVFRLSVATAGAQFAFAGAGLGIALLLSVQHNPRLLPLVVLLLLALFGGTFLFCRAINRTMRALKRDLADKQDYKCFIENAPHGFFRIDEDGSF